MVGGGIAPSGVGAGGTDAALDDLSPIERSASPYRLNLFQSQDTLIHTTTPSKHSRAEQVSMMQTLKTKLQKYQSFIDRAFLLIAQGADEQIFEGCTILTKGKC